MALEYILIVAVVSLALVGAFKAYGRIARKAIHHSVVHPSPAYNPDRGTGGALRGL